MNNSKVIFKGCPEAVKKHRRTTMYWLVTLLGVVLFILFFVPPYPWEGDRGWIGWLSRGGWYVAIAGCITVFIFSSLAMIPQNLEIREDGIAPPTRGYIDAIKGRERFIMLCCMTKVK